MCLNAVLAEIFNLMKEAQPKILCIGGNKDGKAFELSTEFCKSDKIYPSLPLYVSFHDAAKLNNCIYCIGGEDLNKAKTDQVFRLDRNKTVLKWAEAASLNEAKSDIGCAVFNGNIIVTGASDGDKVIGELYKEESNAWRLISSNENRYGNGLIACKDRIYASGGWEESSVECLDGNWLKVDSMKTSRFCFAAVNCGEFIYAIGGYSERSAKNCVEKFNPHENKWVEVKPMNFARWGHAACVVENKIVVIGGINAENRYVHEIECYDTTGDTWSIVGEIDINLFGHALVV